MTLKVKLDQNLDNLSNWLKSLRTKPPARYPSQIEYDEENEEEEDINEYQVGKKMSTKRRFESEFDEIKNLRKDIMLAKQFEVETKKLEKESKELDKQLREETEEPSSSRSPDVSNPLDFSILPFTNPELLDKIKNLDYDTLLRLTLLRSNKIDPSLLFLLQQGQGDSQKGFSSSNALIISLINGLLQNQQAIIQAIANTNKKNESDGAWNALAQIIQVLIQSQGSKDNTSKIWDLIKENMSLQNSMLLKEIDDIRAGMKYDSVDDVLNKLGKFSETLAKLGLTSQNLSPELMIKLKEMDNEIKKWSIDKQREMHKEQLEEARDARKQEMLMKLIEGFAGLGYDLFGDYVKAQGKNMAKTLTTRMKEVGYPVPETAQETQNP